MLYFKLSGFYLLIALLIATRSFVSATGDVLAHRVVGATAAVVMTTAWTLYLVASLAGWI